VLPIGQTKLFGVDLVAAKKIHLNRKSRNLERANADQQSANEEADQQFTS